MKPRPFLCRGLLGVTHWNQRDLISAFFWGVFWNKFLDLLTSLTVIIFLKEKECIGSIYDQMLCY